MLDDAYPSCVWTWYFHPFHLIFNDFILDSCVHWAHENFPSKLERLVWIRPHLRDMYFMMENLSMFHPSLEGDILLCHLHDIVILHDVIAILHNTFHGDGFFMVLMMLRRINTRKWYPGILWDFKFPPLTLPH